MSKNNIHGTELWYVYRSTLPSAGMAASSSQQPLLERDTILSAIHTHRKTTNENNNSHRMAAIQRSTSDAMRTEEKVACGWTRRSIAEGRTDQEEENLSTNIIFGISLSISSINRDINGFISTETDDDDGQRVEFHLSIPVSPFQGKVEEASNLTTEFDCSEGAAAFLLR